MPFPLTFHPYLFIQQIMVSWCTKVSRARKTLSTSPDVHLEVRIRNSCNSSGVNQRSSLRSDARLRPDNGYRRLDTHEYPRRRCGWRVGSSWRHWKRCFWAPTCDHSYFHSTTVLGNPIGGLVFSSAFNNGQLQQLHEWTVSTKHPSGLAVADMSH